MPLTLIEISINFRVSNPIHSSSPVFQESEEAKDGSIVQKSCRTTRTNIQSPNYVRSWRKVFP
jgi:hypothetical protein